MSNIKKIQVIGYMPFNSYDYETLNTKLGTFNSPVFGLRIRYLQQMSVTQPNNYGGQTTFIYFTLEGNESVSAEYIYDFIFSLQMAGGWATKLWIIDIEENFEIIKIVGQAEVTKFIVDRII